MPSRLGLLAIVAAWLAVTGHVVYHDVWPRYFGDAPPPIRIDLIDEATQLVPVKWVITRGNRPVGTLQTRTEYVEADDTFRFVNNYRNLTLDVGGVAVPVTVLIPKLETVIRVGRDGDLREQSMAGELQALLGPAKFGDASAEITGVVTGGVLKAHCVVRYPASAREPTIERDLDPVPVPAGQVLNPLMPVNRLEGINPGRRWVVREVDPLKDAMALLFKEIARENKVTLPLPAGTSGAELIAEVASGTEEYPLTGGRSVECRVITYRGETVAARTWVSIADGRVMRQEATAGDEVLRFDRQD
jgi:hypothetical protein